jgi:hypothetical protein
VSFTHLEVNRTMVVVWGDVEVSDLAEVRHLLADFGQRIGRPPIYLAITPPGAPPPRDAVRKEMIATMRETSQQTETLHLVLEAQGLRATALRSVVASMFLIAGTRQVFVHSHVEEALARTSLSTNESDEVRRALASHRAALEAGGPGDTTAGPR